MLYHFRVHGAEFIPQRGRGEERQGAILASSHVSFLDPLVLGSVCSAMVVFTPRRSLSDSLLYRVVTLLCPVVPIGRGTADLEATRRLVELLKAGHLVAVFPEQTRTTDGRLGSVKGGVHLLAHRAKVPVIPCLIKGGFEIWPRQRRFPKLTGSLQLRIGPGRAIGQEMRRRQATQWIEEQWCALGGVVAESDSEAAHLDGGSSKKHPGN